MTSIPHFVYELVDPRDNSIFYVGITIDLYGRYKQHMHCDGINPHKDKHIQDIVASGHLPVMRTVERVACFEEAIERESYWIRQYLQQGRAIVNISGVPPKNTKKGTKKVQHFVIADLDNITFIQDGITYNAADAPPDVFEKKAAQHANFGDIGWDALRQRSNFLSELWLYCQDQGCEFPYTSEGR